MAKNGIWSKTFFVKLIYLISRIFLAWTFLIFLAYSAILLPFCLHFIDSYLFIIFLQLPFMNQANYPGQDLSCWVNKVSENLPWQTLYWGLITWLPWVIKKSGRHCDLKLDMDWDQKPKRHHLVLESMSIFA